MTTTPLQVFIADDSSLIRARLAATLHSHQRICVVGQAADAIEAMSGIRALRPDAIILDWHMPHGGGLQVLCDLQRELEQEQVQGSASNQQKRPLVIVLTNYCEPPYRDKALAAGADFFLDKSSQFNQVSELLIQNCGLTASLPREGYC